MSDDLRPDRADDVVRPRHDDDVPVLRPLPPDRDADLRIDFVDDYEPPPPPIIPPPDPGFGFWMAVVWCLLYFAVMQILAAIVFGLPIMFVAVAINMANNRPTPVDVPGMMSDPVLGTALILTLVCSHLAGLLFGWLILRWRCGRQRWKRRIALSRGPTMTHAVLVLIGLPAMLALSSAIEPPIMRYVPSLSDIAQELFGIHIDLPGIEALMPLLQKTPWPLAIFAVAVLPAINEEFWTRGFLGQGLSARYKTWAVVLIVSFLFGCLHLDPRQGLGAMLLGAAIHGAYLATRSLWVAIAVHGINNGLAVIHVNEGLFPVLKPLEDILNGDRMGAVLLVGSAAFLFGAVCYALYETRCKLVPATAGMPVWEPPDAAGVELPPPQSGTVVAHDPLSPVSVSLVLVGAIAFGAVLAAYA